MHIFISYSKKDTRKLASDLAAALNARPGITAWVDLSLRAGPSWETQIQSEILRCDYFVVLYSPDINRHLNGEDESYVLTEISYAKYTAKKPIIPVMAQTTAPPITLTRAHYIDYTLPGLTLSDLVDAICGELGVPVVPTPAPTVIPRRSSLDLLPVPFAWVEIPGGKVTIEKKVHTLSPYKIAKYPLTNAQYRLFVEAGGYDDAQWWTEAGWQQRQQAGWTAPRYWTDSKWNGAEYPVVGVSWYEGVAYCQWLSSEMGEAIMLPSEAQWQYAAQGDDGRAYPWGKQWDCEKCNNSVKPCDSNQTTPVRQYEGKGDSPFGVVDMAGNVWEWCRTAYETKSEDLNGTDVRVLRGGSWNVTVTGGFRCDYRNWDGPHDWDDGRGFRLALS